MTTKGLPFEHKQDWEIDFQGDLAEALNKGEKVMAVCALEAPNAYLIKTLQETTHRIYIVTANDEGNLQLGTGLEPTEQEPILADKMIDIGGTHWVVTKELEFERV